MKRVVVSGLVLALVLGCILPVQADKLSQYKKEKSDINNKLNQIDKNKKVIKKQIEAKKDEKEYLTNVQKNREKEYQQLKSEKEQLEEIARQLDEELRVSEENYNSQKELLKKRLKIMYENSSVSYMQTLIESKSIVDFFERLQLISLISKNDKQLVEQLDACRKDVEYKKQQKESEKLQTLEKVRNKEKLINQIKVSRAGVDEDIKKYQLTLEELEKQEDDFVRRTQQLNKEITKLMSKRKYGGGVMKWPLPSSHSITSEFGYRYHPILKKNKLHTGIDIRGSRGASITAAASGKVIISEWQTGYGYTIVIDHGGGIATRYAHCSKLIVRVGENVETGQTIAKVGSTGYSTGPHLHFEVIKDGNVKNPMSYLK